MGASTLHTVTVLPPPRVFLGRDAELAALVSALRSDVTTGRFIVLQGPAGIGKTSLIDAALARAHRPAPPLRARADSMGRRHGHRLLVDALAPVLTEDDRALLSRRHQYGVGERLHSIIDRMAAQPTVFVLEDLHQADSASLALLARLARTVEQAPLLVIGSLRTQARHETRPALDHLLGVLGERGVLRTIELGPLPNAACLEITEHLTGGGSTAPWRGVSPRPGATRSSSPRWSAGCCTTAA